MRGGVSLNLVVVVLGSLAALAGCGDPIAQMCEARADYFDACAGKATDGGWNLIKDYSFYGVQGREEFLSACQEQGRKHVDSMADDVEADRLKEAFGDQTIQYKDFVTDGICGPVP